MDAKHDNAQNSKTDLFDNPRAFGDDCVAVNRRVWYRDFDGVRAVFVDDNAFYSYPIDDLNLRRFCACQLVQANLAKPGEVSKAFAIHSRMLHRFRQRMDQDGVAGVLDKKSGPQGRHKIDPAMERCIVKLYKANHSKRSIADQMGISEGAVRHVLRDHGYGPGADSPTLDFHGPEDAQVPADESSQGAVVAKPELPEQPVQATSIPYASEPEQMAAKRGMIEEAPVRYQAATDVPMLGALLGLAFLDTTQLLTGFRKHYGKLKPGWYGLRATVWTLFVMALLRIKGPEQLKGVDPAALGRAPGLPRAPEVKTVRRKLKELSMQPRAADLHRWLAQQRLEASDEAASACLYVDGHTRVYSGKRKPSKTYVTRLNGIYRAQTDYWVSLADGRPLLVVHATDNQKLTQMMDAIMHEVRQVVGQQRLLLVFDRAGWSREMFQSILDAGFDLMTYRKGAFEPWDQAQFQTHEAQIDGHKVSYELAEQELKQEDWPDLHGIAVKRSDGRQTHIVYSGPKLDPVLVAYRMFGRWQQENWFRYMMEQFALDALVDYGVEADDAQRLVINPQWRDLDKQVKEAAKALKGAEAAYGRAVDLNEKHEAESPKSKTKPPVSAKKLKTLQRQLEDAGQRHQERYQQRRATDHKVPLGHVSDGDPIKLQYERKLISDTIKIAAYEVETILVDLIDDALYRSDQEGRAVIREAFQTPGDILPKDGQLHICLNQLSAPRYTKALMALCDKINDMNLTLPETGFHLRFHVKTRA